MRVITWALLFLCIVWTDNREQRYEVRSGDWCKSGCYNNRDWDEEQWTRKIGSKSVSRVLERFTIQKIRSGHDEEVLRDARYCEMLIITLCSMCRGLKSEANKWLLFVSPGLRLSHRHVWHRNEIGTKQTFTPESHHRDVAEVNRDKGWTLRNGNLLAALLLWQPTQQNGIRNTQTHMPGTA